MQKVRSNNGSKTSAEESAAEPRRPLSPLKKVLFAALTAFLALAMLEIGLRVLNVGVAAHSPDPFVGFSGYYPLFVKAETAGGDVWKTADTKRTWFNDQSFPDHKPAGAYRIFCLGGSTTYGRPYDDETSFCGWLREFLPLADSTRSWDVINAGGISYASYRVARVAEELIAHQPDLLIVYTGHNEFLERRTYADLTDSPQLLRDVGGWLSRLRVFSAIRSMAAGDARDTRRPALPGEVETILDSSVGLDAYQRDDVLRDDVLEHFRFNLHRIVDLSAAAGSDVVFIVPASQLRDCRPFKSEPGRGLTGEERTRLEALMATAGEAAGQQDWDAVRAAADEALSLDDRYAEAYYWQGTALWHTEEYQPARESFIRARDEDICTLRATTPITGIVREVAAERKVPLVDFADLADRLAEQGIPGADLFLDHVHPTIEGNRQLALAIVAALDEAGMLRISSAWSEAAVAEVTADVESRIDPEDHARALLNLSKVLSWAGKHDEADRLALLSDSLLESDADALYQVASAQFRDGNLQAALETFTAAVAADPDFAPAQFGVGLVLAETGRSKEALPYYERAARLQPRQLEIRFNFGNALSDVRDFAGAEREYRAAADIEPDFAEAHHLLGIALAEQGRIAEAAKAFRRAVDLDPDNPIARSNLEQALELIEEAE